MFRAGRRSLAFAFALALPAAASAPAWAYPSLPFDAPVLVLDGDQPIGAGLTAGDVDGDGLADLVAFKGDRVEVRFGTASPGIGPRLVHKEPVDGTIRSGLVADLDGDGAVEIAAAVACSDEECFTYSRLRVWRSSPSRTLELVATLNPAPVGVFQYQSIVAGDFDDDGDLDLAAGQTDALAIYRNDGEWAFPLARTFLDVPSQAVHATLELVSGDFDGNGRDDLARLSRYSSTLHTLAVVVFDGPGLEGAVHTRLMSDASRTLAAGDLDGDGVDDLVRLGTVGTSLELYRNGPAGMIEPQGALSPAEAAFCVGVGDVDGDGVPDVVSGATNAPQVSVFAGQGGFFFAAPQARTAGGPPNAIAWHDADLDGRLDLVVGSGAGVPIVAYGSAAQVIAPSTIHATAEAPASVHVADVDGDGRRDFAALAGNAMVVTVQRTAPDGVTRIRTDVPLVAAARNLVVADLDGDGAADLVTAHVQPSSQVDVRRADGAGGFLAPVTYAVPSGVLAVRAADLDADGTLDLLAASAALQLARPLLGNGDGGFVAAPDVALPGGLTDFLVHDLAGDGRPDFVALEGSTSSVRVLVQTGPGLAFASGTSVNSPGGVAAAEVLDADGDGWMDLALGGSGNGPALLRNLRDGTFAATGLAAGQHVNGLRAADLDGDGDMDLVALANPPAGGTEPGCLHVLRGHGDGTFDPSLAFLTVDEPRGLTLGDVTGDQRADILVASRTGSEVQLVPNRSSGPVGVDPPPSFFALSLRVSPTPASSGPLRVTFAGRANVPVAITVFSVDGRRVGPAVEAVAGGDGLAVMSLAAPVRAGIYLVRAEQSGRATVARAVVLH